ncbi:hypothetical protein GCM10009569_05820 [Arthrobacter russicus]
MAPDGNDDFYHPWRELRNLGHVNLHLVEMSGPWPGRTNGIDTIWLDKNLQQVERRCVLTHELVHLRRGHTICQTTAAEIDVRVETARRLISLEALIAASRWSKSIPEVADELWVVPMVLTDRIEYLRAHERAALVENE